MRLCAQEKLFAHIAMCSYVHAHVCECMFVSVQYILYSTETVYVLSLTVCLSVCQQLPLWHLGKGHRDTSSADTDTVAMDIDAVTMTTTLVPEPMVRLL